MQIVAMPVCGRPVADGLGLRARYCAEHHRELTEPAWSQLRVPSRAPSDPWLLPLPDEIEEAFG